MPRIYPSCKVCRMSGGQFIFLNPLCRITEYFHTFPLGLRRSQPYFEYPVVGCFKNTVLICSHYLIEILLKCAPEWTSNLLRISAFGRWWRHPVKREFLLQGRDRWSLCWHGNASNKELSPWSVILAIFAIFTTCKWINRIQYYREYSYNHCYIFR